MIRLQEFQAWGMGQEKLERIIGLGIIDEANEVVNESMSYLDEVTEEDINNAIAYDCDMLIEENE